MKARQKAASGQPATKARRSWTRRLSPNRFAEISDQLFEWFPDAILLLDRDRKIVRANARVEAIFGYDREQLREQQIEMLVPERCREPLIKRMAEHINETGDTHTASSLELFARRKNTGEFPVEITFTSIGVENERLVMAVVREITQLKLAAENARRTNAELSALVTELQRRDREMQSLISMDDLLQSCTSQEDAYKVIGFAVAELFEEQTGCLAILLPSGQYLEIVARWGNAPLAEPVFSLDDCWALRRGQLHEVADFQTGLLCRHWIGRAETHYLCIPLTVQGETLGVFCLAGAPANTSDHQISQLQLAVTVSESIKLALSNLRLREKLRAEAIHDPLTGLFNRRYLEETLLRELHRARRRNSPLCVAMLDLDDFKRFNDTNGHDAGDTLLREVGRLMREKLRKSDISCRYGGEEFVIVLPDSSLVDAEQRIEQIRALVKEVQIQHGNELLAAVTLSAGLAQADEHNFDANELLRAADKALYAAKHSGRDRVISHGAKQQLLRLSGDEPPEA